jgi:hypothetical protein
MWIFIIIGIFLIIGIYFFKKYDKDFIVATQIENNIYHLIFETEKEIDCILLDTYTYKKQICYVFIPINSLKKIPDEDIIILSKYSQKDSKLILNFADRETDEFVYMKVKKQYYKEYNFAE